MAESADLKKFRESLKWWSLTNKGEITEKQSKSALASCHPTLWRKICASDHADQEASKRGTFAAIPGALIAAAIAAKCDVSLLLPLCLIIRLKGRRATMRASKADLAAFLGVDVKTIYHRLREYQAAGILDVDGGRTGQSLQITMRATNRKALYELAGTRARVAQRVYKQARAYVDKKRKTQQPLPPLTKRSKGAPQDFVRKVLREAKRDVGVGKKRRG